MTAPAPVCRFLHRLPAALRHPVLPAALRHPVLHQVLLAAQAALRHPVLPAVLRHPVLHQVLLAAQAALIHPVLPAVLLQVLTAVLLQVRAVGARLSISEQKFLYFLTLHILTRHRNYIATTIPQSSP
jgi:hypothetical protein